MERGVGCNWQKWCGGVVSHIVRDSFFLVRVCLEIGKFSTSKELAAVGVMEGFPQSMTASFQSENAWNRKT